MDGTQPALRVGLEPFVSGPRRCVRRPPGADLDAGVRPISYPLPLTRRMRCRMKPTPSRCRGRHCRPRSHGRDGGQSRDSTSLPASVRRSTGVPTEPSRWAIPVAGREIVRVRRGLAPIHAGAGQPQQNALGAHGQINAVTVKHGFTVRFAHRPDLLAKKSRSTATRTAEDAGRRAREIAELPRAAPPCRHQAGAEGAPAPGNLRQQVETSNGWRLGKAAWGGGPHPVKQTT
jgi:hypothetical protein